MRNVQKLWLLMMCLAMTACISFSIADTKDAIVSAKYTLAGVNNTITALVSNQQISKDQAQLLATKADQVEQQLNAADVLVGQGKPNDALDALRIANNLLLQLQRDLQAKGNP